MHELEEIGQSRDTWIFLVFALWGGLCHYIGGLRAGKRAFSLLELLGDLVISGFAGMLAFAICAHLDLGDWLTAAAVGISGHMGSRSVFLIERYLKRRWLPAPIKTEDEE